MRIWVDADSCPRPVRDAVVRAAIRTAVPATFVANRPVPGIGGPGIGFELCPAGPDAADDRIVAGAGPGDLAVTRDIPLAARLVEKGILALNDRGDVYTAGNVRERLSVRDFMVGLAADGLVPDRIYGYGKKELKAFADAFDRVLTRLLREEKAASARKAGGA